MRQNEDEPTGSPDSGLQSTAELARQCDDLTRSLSASPTCRPIPSIDLSRYEATLWRQACQILFTLRCLDQRKPWERLRLR